VLQSPILTGRPIAIIVMISIPSDCFGITIFAYEYKQNASY
jgi:hypothetical protein